ETIRQYARGRLAAAGEEPEWRDRHLNYFVDWAETSQPHLAGPDTFAWLSRVELEHDNVRAGLTWALTREDKAFQGLQLASLSGAFWQDHGYISEGRKRLSAAMAQPGAENPENALA